MVTTVAADPGGLVGSDKTPPNQTYLQTYNTDAFMASLLFTKNQQELGQNCLFWSCAALTRALPPGPTGVKPANPHYGLTFHTRNNLPKTNSPSKI